MPRAPPTHRLRWDRLGTGLGVVMRQEEDHVIAEAKRQELLTWMVMQVEHRELYWFRLSVPYIQCKSWSLYCLAPESACSRGVQADCERGLSPKSRLRVVDRAMFATLECVCVWSCLVF